MKNFKTLTAALATGLAALTVAVAPVAVAGPGHDHAEQMRAKLGQPAPDFTLTDLDGNEHTLREYTKQGMNVMLE